MAAGKSSKTRGGIDLGGSKIQVVVVDGSNDVLGEARAGTPREGGPPAIAAAMAATLEEAAEKAGVARTGLAGVGVGSPGEVDQQVGTVAQARNLSDWVEPFPLAATLAGALGTEVRIGNDVQVATAAEFELGAAREFDSLLGVFWGTGVGGGLILDRKPWLGRGAAGEIGHMVIKRGGARCTCGRHGCLEAYAGRGAMEIEARKQHEQGRKTDLFKLMHKHDRDRLTSGIWERAIESGDELAVELIDRAIEALGAGIASAVNLLDPPAVVFGGGMGVRFGEPYLARVREAMQPHLFRDSDPPAVRIAALGDLGGAIGAALLVA